MDSPGGLRKQVRKINAAVLRRHGAPLALEALELDDIRHDELLVRVVACGVCHTDVACRDAIIPVPLPIVLGHEGAGVVEQVGHSVTTVHSGDHVLLSFSYCRVCPPCLSGASPYCDRFGELNFGGARADGSATLTGQDGPVHGSFFGQSAFASHVLVRGADVVPVSRDLPLDVLAPLGCSAQTGAGAVLNTLKPAVGEGIAVFGVGTVGLAAIMAARIAGCQPIIAIDRVGGRLQLARDLGATHCVAAAGVEQLAQAVRDIYGPVRYSIDTTGNGHVIAAATQVIEGRGTCLMLGVSPAGARLPIDIRSLVRRGITLRGVVEGDSVPSVFIPTLVEHYREGRFPLDRLIQRYALSEINRALEDAATCAVVKPVVIF